MDELDKIIQNINIYNTIQQQYRSQTEKIREEVEEIEKRISKLQKEINDGKDTMELVNQPEQNKQAAENVIEEENCSDLKKNNFHRSATMFSRLKYRVLFGIECVFAMLSLGTVFMKWFDINYIPRVINEYPSEKPFGNLYYLVTALMELEDSRYLDDLALPILSMMSVCILVCLMVLFLGNSLWRVMIQKEKKDILKLFRHGFICEGLASIGTYILAFLPWDAGWFIGGNNTTMEYVYPEEGAIYALILFLFGVIVYLVLKRGYGCKA